nr:MAG: hypothetical protein CM15mV30_0610 [uncultured marine virus]
MSFDLNSLYPHLIMQYNISPDTIVDNRLDVSVTKLLNKEVDTSSLSEQNLSMRQTSMFYKRETSFLLQ